MRRLHPGSRPSQCPLQYPRRSFHSRPQASFNSARPSTPVTESSARKCFSAGASSAEPVVYTSALFLVAASDEFISTSVIPIQNRRCGPSTSALPRQPQDRAFFARNRRLGFSGIQLPLSPSLAVVIEGVLVPADDDPPARSVSPASAIVKVLPVRPSEVYHGPTKPSPSHGNPFTSFSKETFVRWFERLLLCWHEGPSSLEPLLTWRSARKEQETFRSLVPCFEANSVSRAPKFVTARMPPLPEALSRCGLRL